MPDPKSPLDAMPPSDMDFDGDAAPARVPGNRLRSLALGTGSVALLLAMATDALAVAGRHLGIRFLGAIEIVEACVAVAATSAIVIATVDGTHARVRIVLEQVGERVASALERLGDVCSALFLLMLAAGSIWLASDLWHGHEVTEVLGLPLRWFRLFWIAGVLLAAVIFAMHARKPRR